MKVYTLEVFWGCDWETVAVYSNRESAIEEGNSILKHSAGYVEFIVNEFDVKD